MMRLRSPLSNVLSRPSRWLVRQIPETKIPASTTNIISTQNILRPATSTQRFQPFSMSLPRAADRRQQSSLPASYWRGGTSRAVIFNAADLPPDRSAWPAIFRGVVGSPDAPYGRQLDGMGGGLSSLSKICVVGKCGEDDAEGVDVDYTFAAIGVRDDEVDFSSNCGNMTSAIGPFAIEEGLVKERTRASMGESGDVTVRIRNTNTGKVIDSTFPTADGKPDVYGDFAIDGVVGTAAKIRLAFLNPGGSKTGKLLPTSSPRDTINNIAATCIDCGNPCVFVSASDFSVPGNILPDAIEVHPTLPSRLDDIRRKGAVRMGIASSESKVPGSIPKIAMVSEGVDGESDITVRAISVGQPHRAVPITVAMALAAATKVEGSVPWEVCRKALEKRGNLDPDGVTIGHPTGRLLVSANFADKGKDDETVTDVTVFRTARLLMKGEVFWRT